MIDAEKAYSRTKDFYGLDSIEYELNEIYNNHIYYAIQQGKLCVKDVQVREGIIDFVVDALKDLGYSVVRIGTSLNISWIRH